MSEQSDQIARYVAAIIKSRLEKVISQNEEFIKAFQQGMRNTIYDFPQGHYRRTGNLLRSVEYARIPSTEYKVAAIVYTDIYYAKRTAFTPTNTVSKLGYYLFSYNHVKNFLMKDLINQGIY